MADHLAVVREILKEVLSVRPLKGARLKPFVVMEFERRTGEKFARAFYNFPKFSDLLAACDDLVEIDRSGATDIVVNLRAHDSTAARPAAQAIYLSAQPYIQAPLWHAFTNPDPHRRRFYHRKTAEVVHYVEDQADAEFIRKVSGDQDFVEIKPIARVEHSAWMKEFINSQQIPEATRSPLLSIAALPYTSHVNRAFSAALEKYVDAWRRFRTAKVLERVKGWAQQNDIVLPDVLRSPLERGIKEASAQTQAVATSSAPMTGVNADTKKLLHALVDALEERELPHVLIPASVLSRIAGTGSQ